jgi:hypothetical protein
VDLESEVGPHLERQEVEDVALVEALLLAPRVLHPQLHALLHQARHLHGMEELYRRNQLKAVFAVLSMGSAGKFKDGEDETRSRF